MGKAFDAQSTPSKQPWEAPAKDSKETGTEETLGPVLSM
jgi:hypothetical protein